MRPSSGVRRWGHASKARAERGQGARLPLLHHRHRHQAGMTARHAAAEAGPTAEAAARDAVAPLSLVNESLGSTSYLVDLGDRRALVVDPAHAGACSAD